MAKRVQMSRQHPWRAEHPDAVIVARPSKWGNPYRVGEEGWNYYYPELVSTREDCVTQYQLGLWHHYGLETRPGIYITEADVRRELAGKDLACWCPLDQPCHADVLLEIANGGDR